MDCAPQAAFKQAYFDTVLKAASRILKNMKTAFPSQLNDVRYYAEESSCLKWAGVGDLLHEGFRSFGGGTVKEMPDDLVARIFAGPIAVGHDTVRFVLDGGPTVVVAYREIAFVFVNKLQQKLFEIALKDVPRLPDGFIEGRIQAAKDEIAKAFVPVGVEVVRAIIKHLDRDTDLVNVDENELGDVVEKVLDARGLHGPAIA